MRNPNIKEAKKISIKDIAQLTQTSIATVSRVLNNKEGGYSDETAKKDSRSRQEIWLYLQ